MLLGARLEMWKYKRERRKLDKEMRRIRVEARQKKDEQIYEDWCAEHTWKFDVNDAAINGIKTDSLVKQAEKFYLAVPDKSDENKWTRDATDSLVLTPEAMRELGAAIRRARRESFEWWVKVVGGAIGIVTGLVGALIGLIAVWKRK